MAFSSCLLLPPPSSSHNPPNFSSIPQPTTISTPPFLPHSHQHQHQHQQQQQQQQQQLESEELLFYLHLQQQQHLLDHHQEKLYKMVRKRPASELDLQPESSPYPNPTRRGNTSSAALPATFIGDLQAQSPLLFEPSLTPNPNTVLLPGAGPSALLQSLPPQLPAPPAVCVFPGPPLFPSDAERGGGSGAEGLQLLGSSGIAGSSDDGSGDAAAATAWIDGIIRDLISSATAEVSIPQLIHNVREVIHPCNPGLAAVLEYRLRSLTLVPPALPALPCGGAPEPSEKRRRPAPVLPELPPPLKRIDPSPSFQSSAAGSSSQQLPSWEEPNPNPNPSYPRLPNPQQPQPQRSSASASSDEATAATAAAAAAAAAAKERKEEIRQQKRDEEGLHLLTLLLQCAEAVAADNLEEANRLLLEISELSTPFGTSAQRVAAYFSEAMSARLVSSCLGLYAPLPSVPHRARLVSAFQVFNGISPFVKFSHFTANQAIQEAFEREDRVHIIDLDIMQGLQWPGLFHILASRPGGPPRVRLTGLGSSMEALEATGKRLSDFAQTLGLPFEFCPVAEKVGNLDPDRLGVNRREALAVHWLHHSLYDVTGSDTNTLWLLQRGFSTFHAVLAAAVSFYLLVISDLFEDGARGELMINRKSVLSETMFGISLGYFLSDLAMILRFFPSLGGKEYVLHHGLSIYSIFSSLILGKAHIYILMVLFSEATTPFVNLRWYLDIAGQKSSNMYIYNGMALFLGWLVARILLFIYFFIHIYVHFDQVKTIFPLGHYSLVTVPPILALMNVFWFWKIFKGMMKTLSKKRHTK
ncbi:putative protein SCARECROW 2-like [Cocos nucifera]|uniref:TLC domain-containing protein n=1 Tax=Cocos nucifera TaxID=13894 RepID=A0A8K0NBB3_COCNU|nr:putative protein SCARECROW 2-like [Cocos nucifera]